jgi:prophage antirepressor-like protein
MNEVTNWTFGETEVRTIELDGEPWWVLSDVCKVLELSTPAKIAARLEDDEKGMNQIHTPGGTQNVTIISESGLYSVILRSDKPQAKPFRKWVTSEVLPTIRKHGAYMTQDVGEDDSESGFHDWACDRAES